MKQPSEQEIRIFRLTIFEWTVPSILNDCFRLDINIRNSELISLFKSRLLSLIRPNQSNIYNIFGPIGLTFLTRLRLGLSHLNEHKFR